MLCLFESNWSNDNFSNLYKTVIIGNYIYGIGYEGGTLYKFDKEQEKKIYKAMEDSFINRAKKGTLWAVLIQYGIKSKLVYIKRQNVMALKMMAWMKS